MDVHVYVYVDATCGLGRSVGPRSITNRGRHRIMTMPSNRAATVHEVIALAAQLAANRSRKLTVG